MLENDIAFESGEEIAVWGINKMILKRSKGKTMYDREDDDRRQRDIRNLGVEAITNFSYVKCANAKYYGTALIPKSK